ncbi:MAG TPA: hypothetical protein VGD38_02330 [Pyrinomonadaceae bacterium]
MIDTVRGRLTLWYISSLALILILFGISVYVMLSRALHRRVDEGLRSTIEISITSLTHDTQEGQSPHCRAQSHHSSSRDALHHSRESATQTDRRRTRVAA